MALVGAGTVNVTVKRGNDLEGNCAVCVYRELVMKTPRNILNLTTTDLNLQIDQLSLC